MAIYNSNVVSLRVIRNVILQEFGAKAGEPATEILKAVEGLDFFQEDGARALVEATQKLLAIYRELIKGNEYHERTIAPKISLP